MKLLGNEGSALAVVRAHLGAAGNLGISNLRETMEHKVAIKKWLQARIV